MDMLLSNLNLLATAPVGVAKLRELILTLAVQGKLVPQDPNEEPASVLLKKIRAEKDRLTASGKIKREKPLAEIAEEEKPFGLPQGWEWVRLNSLLQKIGAGSTPLGGREVYVSSGVKFLRSQNVWDDGLRLDGVAFIKPETHAKMSGTVVCANDLLFNITGASIGRCAVVPSDFDEANVSQHVTIVRTVLPALNPFLHKVLVSRHVQQAVMDVQVGVSREGLSIAKLGQFLIPVPPLTEQSRILARVEELMRLCDALEAKGQLEATQHAQLVSTLLGTLTESDTPEELAENWQRVATHFDLLLGRPEAVDALEQTILQLAVRGLLVPQDPQDEPASELLRRIRAEKDRLIADGRIKRDKPLPQIADDEKPFELPQGWVWVRLNSLLQKIGAGSTPLGGREVYASSGVKFLRSQNVWDDGLRLDGVAFIKPETHAKMSGTVVFANDLLFNITGASIGRCAVVPSDFDEGNVSQHVTIVRTVLPALNPFLHKVLVSRHVQQAVMDVQVGVSREGLSIAKLGQFLIPVPPLTEQSRIVARVDDLRGLCSDLRQRLTTGLAQQALLAEAWVKHVV
jgi:type I restriction enzyme S subunit